jgi:hypothetical protein
VLEYRREEMQEGERLDGRTAPPDSMDQVSGNCGGGRGDCDNRRW